MKRELHYFDIYPKIIPEGTVSLINIRQTGMKGILTEGSEYNITVVPAHESYYGTEEKPFSVNLKLTNGRFEFKHTFSGEQEFFIYIALPEKQYIRLSVYALKPDLFRLKPLRGDFHSHTTVSDGWESPEVVAAYYRKAGYDFTVISDHRRYEGSLMAQAAYSGVNIPLHIVNGEEIHPPENHIHTVSFGASHSITDIINADPEKYRAEVTAIMESSNLPENINAYEFASCKWVSMRVREAGGLFIFPHPLWLVRGYHVRDAMSIELLREGLFDAFELLGGLEPKSNNMQDAFYRRLKEDGITNIPCIGSSDSHCVIRIRFEGSVYTNPSDNPFGFNETYSIVFAEDNNTKSIINAVKAGMCTAVDRYSPAFDRFKPEFPHVYGSYRLTEYTLFLLSEYFPLHDDFCHEEGRQMLGYALDPNPETAAELEKLCLKNEKTIKKYK